MASPTTAARVLFLEFINADQFPGQIRGTIPVHRGRLALEGAQSHALRFGLPTTHLYAHRSNTVVLSPEEESCLLARVRAFRPSHIATTHELDPELAARLRADAPAARIGLLDEVVFLLRYSEAPATGLCLANQEASDFEDEALRPLYRWEAGNAAARRVDRNNVYLTLRRACGYRQPVKKNPRYHGVAFFDDTRVAGCAFCGARIVGEATADRTPTDWIERQVRAIAEDLTGELRPNALLLEQIERGELLSTAIRAMREAGLGDVPLLLGIRTDQLVHHAPLLRETLAMSAREGPCLSVFSMGVESFHDESLLLLNKGTDCLSSLRAVRILRELSRDFPRHFSYEGLSALLLSPWSSVAQLHQDMGFFHHLGLAYKVGNLFQARLRAHFDLAITRLAASESLLVDEETDPVMPMSRRKLFREERAWRFQDGRLRSFERLFLRIPPQDALARDPLYRALQAKLAPLRQELGDEAPSAEQMRAHELAFALCLVEEVAQRTEPLDEESLTLRALRRWRSQREPREQAAHRARLGEEVLDIPRWLERASVLVREGLKPTISLVAHEAAFDADRLADRISGPEDLHIAIAAGGRDDERLVVLSQNEATATQVLALEAALRTSPEDGAIQEALGLAYGYPECCVKAWHRRPAHERGAVPWMAVAERCAHEGAIPAALNPMAVPELAFVPCRADCPRATETYERWYRRIVPAALEKLNRGALALTGMPGTALAHELVIFDVQADGAESWRFDPQALSPGDGILRRALRAAPRGVLHLGPGQIRTGGEAGPLALWTATVFPWSAQEIRHADVWRELALAACEPHWLSARRPIPQSPLEAIAADTPWRLLFRSRQGDRQATFFLGHVAPGARTYRRRGELGLSHSPESDLRIVEECGEALAEAMVRVGEAPSEANASVWEEALRDSLRRAGLLRNHRCQVVRPGVRTLKAPD